MSIQNPWRYRFNTFESNTRESNVKMLSISSDTYAKLKNEESDAAIAGILLIYEPVFFAYRDLDQQYGVKSGEREGTTLGFEQYLDQMPLKLRQWESLIRAVYIEDSPEEKEIFPNKRVPFESGTYESRLDALGALKLKTAADAALSTANTQVTSFYNAALGARLVQQMSEGALKQISDLRESQRLLLANELMGVLGQLLFIHRQNLVEVERYFDLSLLRDITNVTEHTVERNVAAGAVGNFDLTGLGINFEKVVSIKFESHLSDGDFYAGETETSEPGTTKISVAADTSAGRSANDAQTQLGADSTHTKINVKNTGTVAGHYKVTFSVEE